jgi:hypothetical protein
MRLAIFHGEQKAVAGLTAGMRRMVAAVIALQVVVSISRLDRTPIILTQRSILLLSHIQSHVSTIFKKMAMQKFSMLRAGCQSMGNQ